MARALGVLGRVVTGRFWCSYAWVSLTSATLSYPMRLDKELHLRALVVPLVVPLVATSVHVPMRSCVTFL